MAVNRKLWKEWFFINDFKSIPCSTCHINTLNIDRDKIFEQQTEASKIHFKEMAEEMDVIDYEGRFIASFECNVCKEQTLMVGKSGYRTIEVTDDMGCPYPDEILVYSPVSIYPAPHLINLHSNIPAPIVKELIKAFALFWQDYSACGNGIRIALERLLDHFDEPGFPIMLHQRIISFIDRNEEFNHLSNKLLAVKWLSNEASHTKGLTRDDVFNALDFIDIVFQDLFNNLETLAKAINLKKGSVSGETI